MQVGLKRKAIIKRQTFLNKDLNPSSYYYCLCDCEHILSTASILNEGRTLQLCFQDSVFPCVAEEEREQVERLRWPSRGYLQELSEYQQRRRKLRKSRCIVMWPHPLRDTRKPCGNQCGRKSKENTMKQWRGTMRNKPAEHEVPGQKKDSKQQVAQLGRTPPAPSANECHSAWRLFHHRQYKWNDPDFFNDRLISDQSSVKYF